MPLSLKSAAAAGQDLLLDALRRAQVVDRAVRRGQRVLRGRRSWPLAGL